MKVKTPKIIIKEDGTMTGATITIDGKELPTDGILGYKIEHRGGEVPTLSIDFSAMDLELNGVVVPRIPKILEGYYVSNMESEEDKPKDA